MKNIFRLLALTLALITVTLAFSSCHGGNDINAFALPEKFDSSREYEISFWAKNDSNMTQVDIYRKAISDFEALYPNIKVNLKLYTNYNDIYKDVITNIPTATPHWAMATAGFEIRLPSRRAPKRRSAKKNSTFIASANIQHLQIMTK